MFPSFHSLTITDQRQPSSLLLQRNHIPALLMSKKKTPTQIQRVHVNALKRMETADKKPRSHIIGGYVFLSSNSNNCALCNKTISNYFVFAILLKQFGSSDSLRQNIFDVIARKRPSM